MQSELQTNLFLMPGQNQPKFTDEQTKVVLTKPALDKKDKTCSLPTN
jgi:hypothetical protein